MKRLITVLFVSIFCLSGMLSAAQAQERIPDAKYVDPTMAPALAGPCVGLFEVKAGKASFCTHGADPAPQGRAVSDETKPVPDTARPNAVICEGDGVSGYRTQVLYVRASDRPDRYGQFLGSIRTWVSEMDDLYFASAQETGGSRRVRLVTEAGCAISVRNVVVGPTGDDGFGDTISALQAQGYNRSDRKYLAFVDINTICGVGTLYLDDQASQNNANNTNASYARLDNGCWSASVAAHEHMHNLGAVQRSAPHSTAYGHCWDDGDIMCYNDGAGTVIQQVCAASHDNRFDCNHDDYFHTNPPGGSYLATRWNAANSRWLIVGSTATYYRIVNRSSNLCLDIRDWSTANGGAIQQWGCGGGQANQQWTLIGTDSGYFRIVSRHSGKVVDVDGVSQNDGAKIHQWDWVGGANQQWRLQDLGGGYYMIVARHSNKAIDVPYCDKNNGIQLQQVTQYSNDCQAFRFESVATNAIAAPVVSAPDTAAASAPTVASPASSDQAQPALSGPVADQSRSR